MCYICKGSCTLIVPQIFEKYNQKVREASVPTTILHFAVLFGTGIWTITFNPKSWAAKTLLIVMLISNLVLPCSLITGRTLNGKLIPSWQRYLINSNSPSGGMNVTTFWVSKVAKLTHWWNVMSPIFSLSPSFSSGIPDRKHFIWIFPSTSHLRVVP